MPRCRPLCAWASVSFFGVVGTACVGDLSHGSLRDAMQVVGFNFYDHGKDVVDGATTTASETTTTSEEEAQSSAQGSSEEDALPTGQLATACSDAPLLGAGNWTAVWESLEPSTRTCIGEGTPRFFRFRAPADGALQASSVHPSGRLKVALWTGDCDAIRPLSCDNLPGEAARVAHVAKGTIVYGALIQESPSDTGTEGTTNDTSEQATSTTVDVSGESSMDEDESDGTQGSQSGSDATQSTDTGEDLPDERIGALSLLFRPQQKLGAACEVGELISACPPTTSCQRDVASGLASCQLLEGDTCVSAPQWLITPSSHISFVRSDLYSDSHFHGCGGVALRDRVWRLHWSSDLLAQLPADGGHLVLTSSEPGVMMALRAPGCTLAEEQACTLLSDKPGNQVQWPADDQNLREMIDAGMSPYLFVDWLDPTGDVNPPVIIRASIR